MRELSPTTPRLVKLMKHFWTADPHINHKNIIQYSNRPFGSLDEMRDTLIRNTNELVSEEDRLYVLGDFAMGENKRATVANYLQRLRCKQVYWILGNHDKHKDAQSLKEAGLISWCGDLFYTRVDGVHVTMCHYAWRTWPEQGRGGWALWGHSHSSLPDDPNTLGMDVGVDTEWPGHPRFFPYEFGEIRELFSRYKKPVPPDHHDRQTLVR